MQRKAVNKYHRASGLEHIGATHANDSIGITNKALADNKARFVGERVFNRRQTNRLKLGCRDSTGGTNERCILEDLIGNHSNLFYGRGKASAKKTQGNQKIMGETNKNAAVHS